MKANIVTLKMVREKSTEYTSKINEPKTSYSVFKPLISDSDVEQFWVMCLDSKNKINALHCVVKGSVDSCTFHTGDALKVALLSNSPSVIFAHNHPSGSAEPSQQDKKLTNSLKESCSLLGIRFLDHLIICENEFFSFAMNSLEVADEK